MQTPVSTAEYNANSSDPTYQAVTKTWSNGPDWEVWTGAQTGSSSHYRSSKLYNSPPYTGFDPAVTARTRNDTILARLISGNDNGTPAIWDGSNYTNAEIADMYVLPQWSQFGSAMEDIALGECGGTLTLQTKLGGGAAPDPFRYQNSAVTDSGGDPLILLSDCGYLGSGNGAIFMPAETNKPPLRPQLPSSAQSSAMARLRCVSSPYQLTRRPGWMMVAGRWLANSRAAARINSAETPVSSAAHSGV